MLIMLLKILPIIPLQVPFSNRFPQAPSGGGDSSYVKFMVSCSACHTSAYIPEKQEGEEHFLDTWVT